ncbi:MAG: class I SAM-dependent methyltransferase [Desulfovibrio sp.]
MGIFGQKFYKVHNKKAFRRATKILGYLDAGMHISSLPLLEYVEVRKEQALKVLQIGSGDGTIGCECYDRNSQVVYTGWESNRHEGERAKQVSAGLPKENLDFHQGYYLGAEDVGEMQDVIFVHDFLHHIYSPDAFLESLKPLLSATSEMLIVTPTPEFVRLTGRTGTVRDGYTLQELQTLVENAGYCVQEHRWLGGFPFTARLRLCELAASTGVRQLHFAALGLTLPLSNTGLINGPESSPFLYMRVRLAASSGE